MSDPVYYRWTYSPGSGEVDLTHNDERHRADAEYHLDVARRRHEDDLQHGYAHRLEGGWRITTWDHKPERDPHVKQKVIEAVRGREGTPLPRVGQTDFVPERDGFRW